jgi:microcystin-dependent protein
MQEPNEQIRKINYYNGLLLTSEEFQLEQQYHTDLRRLHNRSFHGYGIAWGFDIQSVETGPVAKITPGLALLTGKTSNEIPYAREIILLEEVTLNLWQFSHGVNIYIVASSEEILRNTEPYKGEQPIHNVEKIKIEARTMTPEELGKGIGYEGVILGAVQLIQAMQTIDNVTQPVPGLFIVNPDNIDYSLRVYSGLNVIEAEVNRLVLHPNKDSMNPDAGPSSYMEGVSSGNQRMLSVHSEKIYMGGHPKGSTEKECTELNISGGVSIFKNAAKNAFGTLTVEGDVTISGNLSVFGSNTTIDTKTMTVEDNIVTYNKKSGSKSVSGISLEFSGFEVSPEGFTNYKAADYSQWPALLWHSGDKKWKMADNTKIWDIGYASDLHRLTNKISADDLHVHSFLVKNKPIDPNNVDSYVPEKVLTIDDKGFVGIGITTPSTEFHVTGSATFTNSLNVTNAINANSNVVVTGNVSSKDNLALKIGDSTLRINNYADQNKANTSDAMLEVFRGNAPMEPARLLWDETDDVWKIGRGIKQNLVEVATVDHLPRALSNQVNQPRHNFSIGQAIYFDIAAGRYQLALSNSESTTGVFIVTEITDKKGNPDFFTLVQAGFVVFPGSMNFLAGNYYFVDDRVPGKLTTTEPVGISNPIFLAESKNSGYVLPYRPSESSHALLRDYMDNLLVASISPFAMQTPPPGWLECNGDAMSRVEFKRLFDKIGTTFGAGNGAITFNLPDLRGMFVRGWDHGRGIDAARLFASMQNDQMQGHKHNDSGHGHTGSTDFCGYHTHWVYNIYQNIGTSVGHANTSWWCALNTNTETSTNGAHSHNLSINNGVANLGDPTTSSAGDTRYGLETRPKNISLLYCIKF